MELNYFDKESEWYDVDPFFKKVLVQIKMNNMSYRTVSNIPAEVLSVKNYESKQCLVNTNDKNTFARKIERLARGVHPRK